MHNHAHNANGGGADDASSSVRFDDVPKQNYLNSGLQRLAWMKAVLGANGQSNQIFCNRCDWDAEPSFVFATHMKHDKNTKAQKLD
jgi:hypothetical protein